MQRQHSISLRGFTLIEVLVALAIIGILSSMATLGFKKYIDMSRKSQCETNMHGLHKAIHLYAIENEALPATLGELQPRHLWTGYKMAMNQANWKTKFFLAMQDFEIPAKVNAAFLTPQNLKKHGADSGMFHCPEDDNGGHSYALNSAIAGKNWFDLDADVVVIAECDVSTFDSLDELTARHGGGKTALGVTKGGRVVTVIEDEKVVICKIPPGNPDNKHTITVDASAVDAHLATGSTLGPCPE